MAESQRHIIHTQEWQIQAPGQEHAREVHAFFGQLSQGRLSSLLDQYLSRQAAPDEHLRIDTLELDLGRLPAELTEAAIWRALEAALEQQFPGRANRAQEAQAPTATPTAALGQAPALSGVEAAGQALEYFLQYGQLPWWSQEADDNPVVTYLNTLLEAKPPAYLASILTAERAQQRLVAALPTEVYRTVLLALLPPAYTEQGLFVLEELLTALLARHAKTVRLTRQRLQVALLSWAAAVQRQGSVAGQIALWRSIAQVLNLTPVELTQFLRKIWARLPSAQQANR
ncbi:MAG: hypothetical protein KDC54_25205, partial [Lewinella sp.]|nr:hypothetical protein [Lewinella sp.]